MLRNLEGERPSLFLKILEKYNWSVYPTDCATSKIDAEVSVSRVFA